MLNTQNIVPTAFSARRKKKPTLRLVTVSSQDLPVLEALMQQNFEEDSYMRHTPADVETHKCEREDVHSLLKHKTNGQDYLLRLAFSNDVAAGYLLAKKIGTERQPHVASFHMWISGSHRSKGIGTNLMSDVITWARNKAEIRKLELDVMSCNSGGIKLYKRFGFLEEGRRKETAIKDGQYHDLIQMALPTITNQDS